MVQALPEDACNRAHTHTHTHTHHTHTHHTHTHTPAHAQINLGKQKIACADRFYLRHIAFIKLDNS